MDVYVCFNHIEHQGCSKPLAVFLFEEAAAAYCAKENADPDNAIIGIDYAYVSRHVQVFPPAPIEKIDA